MHITYKCHLKYIKFKYENTLFFNAVNIEDNVIVLFSEYLVINHFFFLFYQKQLILFYHKNGLLLFPINHIRL
jgi:hypothetical protein